MRGAASGSLGKLTVGLGRWRSQARAGMWEGRRGQTQNYSGSWAEKEYQETGPLFREEGAIKGMCHLKFPTNCGRRGQEWGRGWGGRQNPAEMRARKLRTRESQLQVTIDLEGAVSGGGGEAGA